MALSGPACLAHAVAVAVFACAARCLPVLLKDPRIVSAGQLGTLGDGDDWLLSLVIFFVLSITWLLYAVRLVDAHGHRVLVRTMFSDSARLVEGGGVLISWPEYIVAERRQFGPWSGRERLPLPKQVLDIDVPLVHVPVDSGLYCLKVNTKVIGVVQSYSVEDLTTNPIAIESRINDVIAGALRNAVFDKPIEQALLEIQRLFQRDTSDISQLISTPAFKVSQLLLDSNDHVAPADEATRRALEIVVERKQEAGKRSILEASMETEAQKVKLRKVALESERSQYMLQQEVFGKEGAAIVEASKHAKVLYVCAGLGGMPSIGTLAAPS